MKSKRVGMIFAIAAVVLLVATFVAALWPVKSQYQTSCGSFLASSDSVYNDAYQKNMGMMGDAAFDTGAYSENQLGLPPGAFGVVARNMANEEVTRCADKRDVTGIVAGVLLLVTLAAGATAAFIIVRGRSGTVAA